MRQRLNLEAGSQERCTPGAMRVRSNGYSLLSVPQHRAFDSVCPLQSDELFQTQAAGTDGKGVFHPYIAPVPRLKHDAGGGLPVLRVAQDKAVFRRVGRKPLVGAGLGKTGILLRVVRAEDIRRVAAL